VLRTLAADACYPAHPRAIQEASTEIRNGLRKGRPEGRPLFMGRLRPSNTNQFGTVGVTQVGEIRSVRTDAGRVFD
jgi:hypothetical protein